MSVENCLLDLFPIEIIDMIFEYLSINDIISGFFNVTPYINQIISNYQFYKINFESISKYKFDIICQHIQGHQMKSLILNDGDDTPNQSNLFLSLFKIDDLAVHLSHLSLIDLNTQSMELILKNINKFQRLSSLKIINNNNTIESAQLSLIYPQLNRLNISSEYYFSNLVFMTNLKHLILSTSCTYNQFQMLLAHCSKLVSLNFILNKDLQENISNIYLNLKRLIINISSQVNMIQMKSLLNCFPSLDYFEIECRSDLDLCDGPMGIIYFE